LCNLQFLHAERGQYQLLIRLLQLREPALVLGHRPLVVHQALPQGIERRRLQVSFDAGLPPVEDNAAIFIPFREVHRCVRSVDQRVGILAVVGVHSDTDAGDQANRMLVDVACAPSAEISFSAIAVASAA